MIAVASPLLPCQRFLAAVTPDRQPTITDHRANSGGYSRTSARATMRWKDSSTEEFMLRSDRPADQQVHHRMSPAASQSPRLEIPEILTEKLRTLRPAYRPKSA